MLKKINLKEFSKFKKLYRKHIIKDFPKNERLKLEGFRKAISKLKEEVYIYEEEGIEKGYCIIDPLSDKYILIAFLAVYKENRGQGVGTKILEEIKEKYSNKKDILLEVENPEFTKNIKERTIQEKRINFYKKADFKIIENISLEVFMQKFKIMFFSTTKQEINNNEIKEEFKKYYYQFINKKNREYLKVK